LIEFHIYTVFRKTSRNGFEESRKKMIHF
jgi:hypothetical protein